MKKRKTPFELSSPAKQSSRAPKLQPSRGSEPSPVSEQSSRAPARDPHVTRRYVVDRREGTFLVVERDDGTILDIEADRLPTDCQKEGVVFDVTNDDWGRATRNRDEERRRNKDSKPAIEKLKKRDLGGDVEL